MPRLTKAQEETQRKIRRLVDSSLPPERLARHILRALLIAIPVRWAVFFGVDPGSFLFNRLLAFTGQEVTAYRYWLQHIYLSHEPGAELTFPGLMRAGLRVVIIHGQRQRCWGFPEGYFSNFKPGEFQRVFYEIETPAGGILRAWFALHRQKVAALELGRTDAERPLKASDGAFLQFLAPLIGKILGEALARTTAARHSDAEVPAPPTGVVVLDRHGRAALQTPVAEEWFEAIADSESLLSTAAGVPTAVWSAVAAARVHGAGQSEPAVLRAPTPLGPVRLEASPVGENGQVAVTLVAHRPSFPPTLPWWWPLTPGERRVLSLVVKGLTNRKISETLVISENTVETHLAHAYKKLKVSSRTQFLARLFREVY